MTVKRLRPNVTPKWRVECPNPDDALIHRLSWTIRSPRGVAVFRSRDRAAALQIGHSMAAIDQLLARVAQLEIDDYADAMRHPRGATLDDVHAALKKLTPDNIRTLRTLNPAGGTL